MIFKVEFYKGSLKYIFFYITAVTMTFFLHYGNENCMSVMSLCKKMYAFICLKKLPKYIFLLLLVFFGWKNNSRPFLAV